MQTKVEEAVRLGIPKYHELMLPMLEVCSDKAEHRFRDVVELLARQFQLSDAQLSELLPSGQQPIFDNRAGWAKTYLSKAGLLESTGRGLFKISSRGLELLASKPKKLDASTLQKFSEFAEFRGRGAEVESAGDISVDLGSTNQSTPEEMIEVMFQKLRRELEHELIDTIISCSPRFFEQLVVALLLKMGYGGSRKDAGQALGKTGDGGIDGIIKEDKLGLDSVYIQAKRWQGTVGRPDIQQFAGALHGHHARKGIFITTSKFSSEARDYVKTIDSRIVLIDGNELAQLMVDYNIGVTSGTVYEIKRLDADYFSEE